MVKTKAGQSKQHYFYLCWIPPAQPYPILSIRKTVMICHASNSVQVANLVDSFMTLF